MFKFFKEYILKFFTKIFKKNKKLKIGLYGAPNGGKTTLANIICQDWLEQDMGSVSNVSHETREIQLKEEITIISKEGNEITFSLIDTPGITTRIDYEEFLKHGLSEEQSKVRAKEATRGVIESIKWIDEMDFVLVVLDSTLDPYSQINVTIIGNLEARKIPLLIVANKIDLKRSNMKRIKSAFPQYEIIGISAKYKKNIDELYEKIFEMTKDI